MKKALLLILGTFTLSLNAQIGTKIKYKQMENPATSSVNLGTQALVCGNLTVTNTSNVGGNSINTGNLRVGSSSAASATLDVTGTMSVSSTTTLNGLTNLGNGVTVGTFSVGSTATVTGAFRAASTMSLGSANLTGGNTGTVAVLSDAVFPVEFFSANSSPADGTTYYVGTLSYVFFTTANLQRIMLPYNCTLVGWSYSTVNNGTNGSAETMTISVRANNSTDYLLKNDVSTTASVEYTASGLSQTYSAGDMINIKIVTPTWATNPTSLYLGVTLWFVRRT